ncbi:hypothetical protein QAD02_016505 [Eretmocerus hayati]|uniref:Uncharacterized protein n=1 Tax=Eretmocerus hayati TaxID=131215 RepID=A0ACC2PCA4_9HYME|nr:hypothetical protein QAD02_016505 [Eretmocerus hayati]
MAMAAPSLRIYSGAEASLARSLKSDSGFDIVSTRQSSLQEPALDVHRSFMRLLDNEGGEDAERFRMLDREGVSDCTFSEPSHGCTLRIELLFTTESADNVKDAACSDDCGKFNVMQIGHV